MDRTEFIKRLEALHDDYANRSGRTLNRNALGPTWRKTTRHFTWMFYKLGLTGNQATVLHLITEFAVVVAMFFERPLVELVLLAVSHIFDNADGDLARIRNQENPIMMEIDELGHLATNIVFWLMLYFSFSYYQPHIAVILGSLILVKWFRRGVKNADRMGQRSKTWMWLVKPTNVMVIYIAFILSSVLGTQGLFIWFYTVYLSVAAIGQSLLLGYKTYRLLLQNSSTNIEAKTDFA